MKLRGLFCACLIFTLAIMLIGCQGGQAPTLPDADNPGITGAAGETSGKTRQPVGISPGHNLLMLMDVRINAEEGTVEAIPMHTAEQHLNLLQVIPVYCHPVKACLDFVDLEINMATAVCDLNVKVTHPVPIAFADLYDLRGIGIFKSNEDPGFTRGPIATQLLNADGYTTAYDESGYYTSFLNPYKAFNKDLPKRIFAHQTTTIEHFTCQFPSLEPDDAQFLYALDASWADPDKIVPGDPETDPNIPDPYSVEVMYIDQISNEASGAGTAIIKVLDWQANCASAEIECPDLFDGPVDMVEAWNSGDGTFLYYVQLVNDKAADPGMYRTLVMAEDELISGKDLVNPGITVDYTNYQINNLTIYNSTNNTRPVAVATADEEFITPGTLVEFDATGSTDAEDGSVDGFLWDLDSDGEFDDSIDGETEFTFNENGTFAINVKVTDSGGLSDVLDMPIIIHVSPSSNTPPTAEATASKTDPAIDEVITLDASDSFDAEDGDPVSWEWDLDNDSVYDDATGETIDYSWDEEGVYNVDVLVKDSGGLGDTLDEKIEITVSGTNLPPTAVAFADKTNVEVGEAVVLDGTDSSDPEDGDVTQYYWDLYGLKTYSDAFLGVVSQKYWSPGDYEVDLKVVDSHGAFDTLDTTIMIHVTGEPNQPPVAVATASDTVVYVDEAIHFDASDSYDPEEGDVATYQWDLNGDGAYFDAFVAEVDWYYTMPGFYDVDVRVCDTPGLCDVLDTKITIQVLEGGNEPPVAVAHADKTYIFEGDTVNFDGGDSYDPEDGNPISWQWDLDDDGQYDDSPFILASKQFNTEGVYLIDLKVTDSQGAWDTLDNEIEVNVLPAGSNFPPEAYASVNCTAPLEGQLVRFTDNSVDTDGTIVSWEWNFDDGNGWQDFTTSLGDVDYTFDDEGVYFVDLRVVDDLGIPDQLDLPFSILVSAPSFTPPSGSPGCESGAGTHVLQIPAPLMTEGNPNTSYAPDIAYLANSTFVMVVGGNLVHVMPPSLILPEPILEDVPWIDSIDITQSNLLAVADTETGLLQLYAAQGQMTITVELIKEFNLGKPLSAVAFDTQDNLYVYSEGEIIKYSAPLYEETGCGVWYVPEIEDLGVVDDMEYSVWNHSLYVVVNDGAGGYVVEVDNVGRVAETLPNVLAGPSRHMDIVIDNSTLEPDSAGCRIEIFGGINTAHITRIDANLNVLSRSSYGYWGIRAAALDEWMTDQVITLEDCCYGWVDMLSPPHDWSDIGK